MRLQRLSAPGNPVMNLDDFHRFRMHAIVAQRAQEAARRISGLLCGVLRLPFLKLSLLIPILRGPTHGIYRESTSPRFRG